MDKDPSTPNPDEAAAPKQKFSEPAKYQLTEPAYINDVHYDQTAVDAGKAIVFFDGVPGYHMRPLNAAAKAMVAQHRPQQVNPLDAMTKITPDTVAAPTK